MTAYAHSKEGAPQLEWHTLREHLQCTAEHAQRFASKWDAGSWGYAAGLWHDLGKFSEAFQRMINPDAEAERGRVNHSSAGALRAVEELGEAGLLLASVIAGHHAGLANVQDLVSKRLDPPVERQHLLEAVHGGADASWLKLADKPAVPARLAGDPRAIEFWTRFLFSALIDADRLDTEHFHHPDVAGIRGRTVSMGELARSLDAAVDDLGACAEIERPGLVNRVRKAVLEDCRERADDPQGVFTLTVPTGGGKTLASMSFALRHAARHGLDRVIVVIPYTSIIEQNAETLKRILGSDNVLEHHSNFDPGDERRYWLDAENWDVPVVVTTSVQFFESLFSNRPSATRKLHSIAKSVVVFDEVQTIPPGLLLPIVDAMKALASTYHASLVLCTATQPALGARPGFSGGFEKTREIVTRPERHFADLQRVESHWPECLDRPEPWPALAERVAVHDQCLVIVHRRDDARLLCELLPPDTMHLSAAMCPKHRTNTLDDIRKKLKAGERCRVVATQVVEAGVDVDFPVVFRALGGLDSLAQAAGRCNREGKLERGRFEIFVPETPPPPGELQRALEVARIFAKFRGGTVDLFGSPEIFTEYFVDFYGVPTDEKQIQTHRGSMSFAKVAEAFAMIENGHESIIVPFDSGGLDALDELRRAEGRRARILRRRLQRYVVSISLAEMARLRRAGAIVEVNAASGVLYLSETFRNLYHEKYGLVLAGPIAADPSALMV